MSELRGLGDIHAKLKAKGGSVLAVCSDAEADCKRVADKNGLKFDILSDIGAATIKAYGLFHHDPFHDLDVALPANILLDDRGRVFWSRISSSVQDRADPAEVAAQVDRLLATTEPES